MAIDKLMNDAQQIAEHFGHQSPKMVDPNRVFWILDIPTHRGSAAKLRFIKQEDPVKGVSLALSLRYCEDHKSPDLITPQSPEQAIQELESLLS